MSVSMITGEGTAVEQSKERDELRILLVEDSRIDARIIQDMLGQANSGTFHLEHVSRLSDGIGRLAHGGIDLVLLDLTLPDSNGLKTLDIVYEHAPEVPIVILTGLDDTVLALHSFRRGAQDYLVKHQLEKNLLLRSIRYGLERKRIDQEMRVWVSLYEKFFDNVPGGSFQSTLEGRLLDCNVSLARMLGYRSPETAIADPDWRLFADEIERKALLSQLAANAERVEFNGKFRTAGGGQLPVVVTLSMVIGQDESSGILQGTALDRSELERLSRKLQNGGSKKDPLESIS